jgi:REP element-mobilizing transposase RayT
LQDGSTEQKLMSNHMHTIVSSKGNVKIGDIWRDFKKFTSKKIVSMLENDITESRRKWMLDKFAFRAKNDKRIKQYKFRQDGRLWKNCFRSSLFFIFHNNFAHIIIMYTFVTLTGGTIRIRLAFNNL